jgi:hypothetical protein
MERKVHTPTRSRRGLTARGRRRLHVFRSKNPRVSFRKSLHFFACNDTCAWLPTKTLDVLLLETLVFYVSENPRASRSATL